MYFFLNLLYSFFFFVITTEVSLIISFIRLCISRSILEYREVYRLAIQGRPKVLPCPREPDGTPWMVHEVKNKQAKFYFPQTRFVKAPLPSVAWMAHRPPSNGTSFARFSISGRYAATDRKGNISQLSIVREK